MVYGFEKIPESGFKNRKIENLSCPRKVVSGRSRSGRVVVTVGGIWAKMVWFV